MGFRLPSAHARHGGPLAASLPRPLRSAFRVWLPSWRFAPSEPGSALFRADSAHGIRPSELCSARTGVGSVTATVEPACRFTRRYTPMTNATSRHADSRLPGFDPFERPVSAEAPFGNRTTAGGSLGLSPFQGSSSEDLGRGFPRLPLTRLRSATIETVRRASEFRSAFAWLRPLFGRSRRRTEQPS